MKLSMQKRMLRRCFMTFPRSRCERLYADMLVDPNSDVVEFLPEVTAIMIERGFIDVD